LCGQSRGVKTSLDGPLGSSGQLGIEQRAQILQRRPRLGERLARERVAVVTDRGQLEHAGLGAHCGKQDIHVGHADALMSSAS